MEGRGSPQLALAPTARLSLAVAALFGSSKGIGRNESHSSGDSALMIHGDEQTERLPFLSQSTQQTWAQVVEVAPGRGKLNMTAQLQEITTRRHRLYLIRRTLRLHAQHYHLRIAGLLPARNKMVVFFPRVRTPCGRSAQVINEGKGSNPKPNKHQPNKNPKHKSQRPNPPHLKVFPLYEGETGEKSW